MRTNLFLLDSIKICVKNTSKLSISISLIYLVNSIFAKIEFLSSNDPIFSINFIVMFIFFTCFFRILYILYFYSKENKSKRWIFFADENYENIQELMKKNKLPTFDNFIDNLSEIILKN